MSILWPVVFGVSGVCLLASACVSKNTAYIIGADEEEVLDEERKITSFSAVFAQPKNELQTFSVAVEQNRDGIPMAEQEQRMLEGKEFIVERDKTNTRVTVLRRCLTDPDDIFCLAFKERWGVEKVKSKNRKTVVSLKQVQTYFKNKDFERLSEISSKSIITSLKKMKMSQLKEVGQAATEASKCLSDTIYVGIASVLEIDFPRQESVELSQSLLEKVVKCSKGEVMERANYRSALFHVWKNNCSQANPLFESQLKMTSDSKALQARATYWKDWCSKQSVSAPSVEVSADGNLDMAKEFPMSFHSLVSDDKYTNSIFNFLTANSDPLVQFRSSTNKALNSILDAVDIFIRNGENDVAFHLLEGLKPHHYIAEPAEVLLYISIVAHRVQFGLLKFQVLSKAFDKNPSIKTPLTMKFYYPNWFYDIVEEHKEKVNPYLLLALIRQESAFNPKAQSSAGARGLMQLLPRTARSFAKVKKNDLFEPKKNIEAGAKFFSHLLKRYNGQVHLALAAYNAGPSAVDDWVKRYPTDNSVLFMDLIPYRETRDYVATILRNWYWYNKLYSPEQKQSNISSPPIEVSRARE